MQYQVFTLIVLSVMDSRYFDTDIECISNIMYILDKENNECCCALYSILTAGSAKNDMPIMAHEAAITFPIHVTGTASP